MERNALYRITNISADSIRRLNTLYILLIAKKIQLFICKDETKHKKHCLIERCSDIITIYPPFDV